MLQDTATLSTPLLPQNRCSSRATLLTTNAATNKRGVGNPELDTSSRIHVNPFSTKINQRGKVMKKEICPGLWITLAGKGRIAD
jgi:hypothetical protein